MPVSFRLLAAVALGLPLVAHAGPAEYVFEPNVSYGEREIEFKAGTAKFKDDGGRESATIVSFGQGFTQYWFTELELKWHTEPGSRNTFDAVEWENILQLTEHNQYPVDVGFLFEVEVPKVHAEGYEFRFGPLFQGDAGPIRWNANLLLERVVHSEEPQVMTFGYQAQAKYHFTREFELGVQAFGDLGKWDHWAPSSEQDHRVGPAVFGKWKLEGRDTIRYNAAWLFSASKAAPQNTFRMQVEYEF